MQGSLGEKIGEGVSADVHAWAPGQVVKLFKVGVRRRSGVHEARMTRAIFAAGGPAPEVIDEVTLDGRFGIVLPRYDGLTLLQLLLGAAVTHDQAGAILAALAISVHNTPPPADIPSLYDWMSAVLPLSGDRVPQSIAAGFLDLIERLPPGDGLCHCDLHTGNVIMTSEGPRLIDWTAAMRAGGALDLAVSQVLFTEIIPDNHPDPQRPRRLNAILQSEYARLAGMSEATLRAAIEPHLPVARVLVLLGLAPSPAQRERLIERVEAALGAGG